MQVQELISLARQAGATPTLYRLGGGGYYGPRGTPRTLAPGRAEPVNQVLAQMPEAKRRRYEAEARTAGIDLTALAGRTMPFCDCSGYVTWALGLPRAPSEDADQGWIWTNSIYEDAQRPGGDFSRIDSARDRLVCRPGALLVYPAPDDEEPGHIGIVSEVDAQGRPLRVLHCSSTLMIEAARAGRPLSAIAETDATVFEKMLDARRPTIAVWCTAVSG